VFPPDPQADLRQAEQASHEQHASVERAAARRAQLGVRRPTLRESLRHWFGWLTRRKPEEHTGECDS